MFAIIITIHCGWNTLAISSTWPTLVPNSGCLFSFFFFAKPFQTTLCCVVLFNYLHFASSFTLQLHGDYGKPCNVTTRCKGDLMCCGCSWDGRQDRGVCLDPSFDQCNWEMGCLTQDGECGCAHSRCEPYNSIPCHNDPKNYKCAPYAGRSDMKKCGY